MKQNSGLYTTSETKNKAILIRFLLFRNIRLLQNTTLGNEQYVLITVYRRQLHQEKS